MNSSFRSSLFALPHFNGNDRRQRDQAMKYIDYVGLQDVAAYEVGELSYATAKLADLARALAAEPRVLLVEAGVRAVAGCPPVDDGPPPAHPQ